MTHPPRRIAYRPRPPQPAPPITDTRADRAEVWGLWHGYTSTYKGVYHRGQWRYPTWGDVWLAHRAEITAWEAAGRPAKGAQHV